MGERKVTQGLVSRIAIGVFGLLTVAMILLAVFDERGALAVQQRRQELEHLKTDVETATKENETMRQQIEELRHDPRAIEKKAREDLKLVKPGEIMIDLTDTLPPPVQEDPSKPQQ